MAYVREIAKLNLINNKSNNINGNDNNSHNNQSDNHASDTQLSLALNLWTASVNNEWSSHYCRIEGFSISGCENY